jgi:uncharacterized protein YcfL
MTKRTLVLSTLVALGLAACGSPEPGPVQPLVGPNAPGVLVIDPALRSWLDVPDGPQNYSFNEKTGLLEYNTIVRNRGSKPMTLAFNADFYDKQGRLVESKDPQTFFIDPQSEKPLQVMANNREAAKMRVQVRAAK